MIPPIGTHFSVACSVVYLSSVTFVPLLKPFDGFRRHLVVTLVGSNPTLCYVVVPDHPGEGEIWGRGSNHSQSVQLQIAAATWRIQSRSWVQDSDSKFYQITLPVYEWLTTKYTDHLWSLGIFCLQNWPEEHVQITVIVRHSNLEKMTRISRIHDLCSDLIYYQCLRRSVLDTTQCLAYYVGIRHLQLFLLWNTTFQTDCIDDVDGSMLHICLS